MRRYLFAAGIALLCLGLAFGCKSGGGNSGGGSATIAANFTATPLSGTAPLTVYFTDASTGSVTSWAWDFDNNGTT